MIDPVLKVRALIDAIVDHYHLDLPDGYKRRDPKEPGRIIKEAWEDELFKIFRLRFDAQLKMIESYLEANPLKAGGGPGTKIPLDHPETDELLLEAFAGMMKDGYQQFMLRQTLSVSWSQYNEDALFWVDSWVTELTDMIDATTGKRLERELTNFISQEGYTVGDVISGLKESGLDSGRAEDIAINEITRTFAKAEYSAGQQLLAEWPDVKVVKTWYTNNDAMVCPICLPLNEESVLMNDRFSCGEDHPPAHPGCRCWMESRTDILDSIAVTEAERDAQMEIPF